MKYMRRLRRVISKSDWIGLRLLFMGSAVDMSLINVEDWKRCSQYYIDTYGKEAITKALDLIWLDYRDQNEFKLSSLAWGDQVTIIRTGDKDKDQTTNINNFKQ